VSVSGLVVLPADQYVASLARKRMAAGALFRDEGGRVLLVNPVYKPAWDLPGGAAEAEESPHAGVPQGGFRGAGPGLGHRGGCWRWTGCRRDRSGPRG
jgi:8-oxo-dGTP pyrophosphatase MutT (NUDIX family)